MFSIVIFFKFFCRCFHDEIAQSVLAPQQSCEHLCPGDHSSLLDKRVQQRCVRIITYVFNKKRIFLNFLAADLHRIDFGNIHGHIMNSVLVVADLMITAHPVRLFHFVHPIALGITYTLFSFVYFCAGGTNRSGDTSIYPFLNWNKPHVRKNAIFLQFIK